MRQKIIRQQDTINLMDVQRVLVKHRKLIILMTVFGLIAGLIASTLNYMRKSSEYDYMITSSFAIVTKNSSNYFLTGSNNPTSADVYLAEDMAQAVVYVCESKKTIDTALKKVKLIGVDAQQVAEALTVSQYGDTQIIELKLRWNNEKEGIQIVRAITDAVPEILVDTLNLGSVSVVNEPESERITVPLINVKLVAMAAMAMFALACAFLLMDMLLHPTLMDVDTVYDHFGLTAIGEIPYEPDYYKDPRSFEEKSKDLAFTNTQEAYASMCHILKHRMQEKDAKCFYLTSSASDEGKSSVCVNLAIQFARLNYKVLLVDLDIRKPMIGKMFFEEVPHEHTLNAVYLDEIDIADAIMPVCQNLDILPTRIEKCKIELDNVLLDRVRSVQDNYDLVILDTAPVGQVSDTLRINRITDEAIMVIKYDSVWLNVIKKNIEKLNQSGVKISSCIVNGVKGSGSSYYQYYNSKYYAHAYQEPDREKKEEKKLFGRRKQKAIQ